MFYGFKSKLMINFNPDKKNPKKTTESKINLFNAVTTRVKQ